MLRGKCLRMIKKQRVMTWEACRCAVHEAAACMLQHALTYTGMEAHLRHVARESLGSISFERGHDILNIRGDAEQLPGQAANLLYHTCFASAAISHRSH